MAPLCEASGCLRVLEESGEGLPATVLAELHTAVGFSTWRKGASCLEYTLPFLGSGTLILEEEANDCLADNLLLHTEKGTVGQSEVLERRDWKPG